MHRPVLDIKPIDSRQLPGGAVHVYSRAEAAQVAARSIADAAGSAIKDRGHAILGLATGATPIEVYRHLAAMRAAGEVSFDRVTTYNLDEYYPMGPLDPRSYRAFMERHLFGPVGIAPNRAHVLDGTVPEHATAEHAAQYDRWIAADGGLDLQLLGLGRNGHIGFNEPSDLAVEGALATPTRLVELHPTTRADAAGDFGGKANVPRHALTMGIAPILAARSIVVLAFGTAKAEAVARSLMGPITAQVPGSLLQSVAPRVNWLLDPEAASLLR